MQVEAQSSIDEDQDAVLDRDWLPNIPGAAGIQHGQDGILYA
jgi:hypothetical protein